MVKADSDYLKRGKGGRQMNQGASGLMAIVIFAILLFFFFSAIGASPGISYLTSSGAINNSGSSNSGVGTPFVLPAGTGLEAAPTATSVVGASSNGQAASGTLSTGTTRYTVQRGEWLNLIAQRYSTTVNAILAVNPEISDPSLIAPGQEILIPAANDATP